MAEMTPLQGSPSDSEARWQGLRLLGPPLVFVAHFAAVYGWAGLVCAFGWGARTIGPSGWLAAGIGTITVAAVLMLAWLCRSNVPPLAVHKQEELRAYEPTARAHFLTGVTRMVGWLALAGMLAVAAVVLLARSCAASP